MTGRRLMLHMSTSLDGFVARSDGVIDWLGGDGGRIPDHGDQRHRINLELLGQIDLIVLGRGGYEDMFRGWSGSDNPMARLMNTLPKVVFSQSLSGVKWNNARLTRRPLEEEIPELKREDARDMVVFGGARIAHSLIRERLVDECRLTVHPVALGEGLSLMHGLPEPQRFELVSSTAYADGCVTQVLRPTVLQAPR
jgi:dihydrofolate reductase